MINFSIDSIIRVLATAVFLFWSLYWVITARKADKAKPKAQELPFFHPGNMRKMVLRFAVGLLIFQLLGLPLLQIPNVTSSIQVIGILLLIIGAGISISARKTLGTNWAHAFEYQVKKKQELVTSGIYRYIRHPIYTGVILGFIGGELVAKSYLVLIGIFIITAVYHQALLEEKLLVKHFGDSYRRYMKRTKILIPYLW